MILPILGQHASGLLASLCLDDQHDPSSKLSQQLDSGTKSLWIYYLPFPPASTRLSARARPRPCAPPVTTKTFPARSKSAKRRRPTSVPRTSLCSFVDSLGSVFMTSTPLFSEVCIGRWFMGVEMEHGVCKKAIRPEEIALVGSERVARLSIETDMLVYVTDRGHLSSEW